MQIHVILNRHGGTLKTTDLDWLADFVKAEFALHGHEVSVEVLDGAALAEAIEAAARREAVDVLIVGGGDGTVSSAAAALEGRRTALGILPAGTMNLFARSLQIPLDLNAAVAALAAGRVVDVDIGMANGQPFVHQFAVGLHARLVRIRERINYGSRYGKILASIRATLMVLQRLPAIELEIEIDGVSQRIKTPAVAVSNNLYGDGHMPFADNPQGGALGVYICKSRNPPTVAKLAMDILLGTWRRNPALEVHTAQSVTVHFSGRTRHKRAVLDGELCDLEPRTVVKTLPRQLRVLVPSDADYHAPVPPTAEEPPSKG
ncbi:diacylglycerol/lipid kinase family protein [Consotaella aegiceratis]|uniref:diacylglycerol/lipid kinase family protein n=1 Tax=Consotaella aegiceratis TaxID=3097961 RepID=UPI002F40C737